MSFTHSRFFVEDFAKWLDIHAAQAPSKQAALLASAAPYLKVDMKELPALISASRSAAGEQRQINSDAQRFWTEEAAKGKEPDRGIAQSFEAKRQAAIQSEISQVKQALSPASWNGVHSHINGTYRASLDLSSSSPNGKP